MTLTESFDEQFGPLLAGTLDMFQLNYGDNNNNNHHHDGPEADVNVIYRAEHKVKEFHRRGKEVVDQARDDVRALARHFQQAQANASRATGQPSAQDHEQSMIQAQQSLLISLKTTKQIEQALYKYQADLNRLQQDNAEEEQQSLDPAVQLDSDVLRLKMYRDMGFTPIDQQGLFTKMLVRSQRSTDARTIDFQPQSNKLNEASQDFFWTNYLWDVVSA
ncbi:hypothetical protein OIO90_000244 [Microbotryomycetes sp. JL221]|nr:hypothetical protein OIO90_000244 [Microbotryomycetes sp. JL221]